MAAPTKAEMLAAVEEAIQTRLTGGAVASYRIGSRDLQYISLKDLMDLRGQLRKEVAAESTNKSYVSFARPQ